MNFGRMFRRGLLSAPLFFWAVAASIAQMATDMPATDMPATDVPATAPDAQAPSAVIDPRVDDAASRKRRDALLATGESALARGDTGAALFAFDRAAMMLHAADTEMAQVRAYLQAGEYRRALAFCAHTAGAHRETAAPAALYAWLLQAGGQDAYAKRVLDEAARRVPGDPVLTDATRELALAWPRTTAALLRLPHRLAPNAVVIGDQTAPPQRARVAASGLLLPGGRLALLPAGVVNGQRVWVRNGLGQTTGVVVVGRSERLGIAVVRLGEPLDWGEGNALGVRDPFAGSPGYVVEFAPNPTDLPAWPWLRLGFFGPAGGNAGVRRLGIDVPSPPNGAVVFDAGGRIAGVALGTTADSPVWVPLSTLRDALGSLTGDALTTSGSTADAAPASRPTPDEVYERALRATLQVVVVAE